MVQLRPMREDEFGAFVEASVPGFAESLGWAMDLTPGQALETAREQYEALLPEGLKTPNHWIWVVEENGSRVGIVWIAEQSQMGQTMCYIYDIEIDEAFRRRGYGRQAMLALEDEARRLGFRNIALNVFGFNGPARNLYRSLGYEERAITMVKTIETEGDVSQPPD